MRLHSLSNCHIQSLSHFPFLLLTEKNCIWNKVSIDYFNWWNIELEAWIHHRKADVEFFQLCFHAFQRGKRPTSCSTLEHGRVLSTSQWRWPVKYIFPPRLYPSELRPRKSNGCGGPPAQSAFLTSSSHPTVKTGWPLFLFSNQNNYCFMCDCKKPCPLIASL